MKEFQKIFGRDLNLIEYYGDENAETVIVAIGSVLGTIKEAVDELVEEKIGVLKIVSFRPFPDEEIAKALTKAKNIAVIDKSISLGTEGTIATEIKRALNGEKKNIVSYILGLGGRDITKEMIKKVYESVKKTKEKVIFVGK